MNGSYHDYLTTKGIGSQEVYDAYYDEYGDSSVWGHVIADTQSNIIVTRMGGERAFVTTHDSITEIIGTTKEENNLILLVLAVLAYNYF